MFNNVWHSGVEHVGKIGAGLKYMYTLLSSLRIVNSRQPAAGFVSD